MLSPMTCVLIAISTDSSTSVTGNVGATSEALRVARYTAATPAPSSTATARRIEMSAQVVDPASNVVVKKSGIGSGRLDGSRFARVKRHHHVGTRGLNTEPVFRHG